MNAFDRDDWGPARVDPVATTTAQANWSRRDFMRTTLTAGGAAVWTLVTLYQRVSTIDMRVDYLAPGRLEPLVAEARVQRKGSQVAVVNIRVYHPATPAETVADGKAVYSIRQVSSSPRPSPPVPPRPRPRRRRSRPRSASRC